MWAALLISRAPEKAFHSFFILITNSRNGCNESVAWGPPPARETDTCDQEAEYVVEWVQDTAAFSAMVFKIKTKPSTARNRNFKQLLLIFVFDHRNSCVCRYTNWNRSEYIRVRRQLRSIACF